MADVITTAGRGSPAEAPKKGDARKEAIKAIARGLQSPHDSDEYEGALEALVELAKE